MYRAIACLALLLCHGCITAEFEESAAPEAGPPDGPPPRPQPKGPGEPTPPPEEPPPPQEPPPPEESPPPEELPPPEEPPPEDPPPPEELPPPEDARCVALCDAIVECVRESERCPGLSEGDSGAEFVGRCVDRCHQDVDAVELVAFFEDTCDGVADLSRGLSAGLNRLCLGEGPPEEPPMDEEAECPALCDEALACAFASPLCDSPRHPPPEVRQVYGDVCLQACEQEVEAFRESLALVACEDRVLELRATVPEFDEFLCATPPCISACMSVDACAREDERCGGAPARACLDQCQETPALAVIVNGMNSCEDIIGFVLEASPICGE